MLREICEDDVVSMVADSDINSIPTDSPQVLNCLTRAMVATLHDAASPVIPVLPSFQQRKSELHTRLESVQQETQMDSESAVLVSMETTGMMLFRHGESTEEGDEPDYSMDPSRRSPQAKDTNSERSAIEPETCSSPTPSSPVWTYNIVPPVLPDDESDVNSEAPIVTKENVTAKKASPERLHQEEDDNSDEEKCASTTAVIAHTAMDQISCEGTAEEPDATTYYTHQKMTRKNINTNIERINDTNNNNIDFDSDITTLETQRIKVGHVNSGTLGLPNKTLETQKNKPKIVNNIRNCVIDTEFDSDVTRLETQRSMARNHRSKRNIEPFEDSDATTLDTQHLQKGDIHVAPKHQGINNDIENDSIADKSDIDNNISTQNSGVSSNLKTTPNTSYDSDIKLTQDTSVSSNRKRSISPEIDFSDNDSDETRFDASQVIVKLGENPLGRNSPGTPQTCTNMSESLISQTKMAALSMNQRSLDRPRDPKKVVGQSLKETMNQQRSKARPMTPDVELTQSSGTTSRSTRSKGSSDRSRSKNSQGQRSYNSKSKKGDMGRIIKERHLKGSGILNKLDARLSKLQALLNTGIDKGEELKTHLTSIHSTIKHIGAANKKERDDIKADTETSPTLKRLQLTLMTERHRKLATVVKQFQRLTSLLKDKSIMNPKPEENKVPSPRGILTNGDLDTDLKPQDNQAENASKMKKMPKEKGKGFIAPFKGTERGTMIVNSNLQKPNTVTTAQSINITAQSRNMVTQSNKQPITTMAKPKNTDTTLDATISQQVVPSATTTKSAQPLNTQAQSNIVTIQPIKLTLPTTQSSVTVNLPTGSRIFKVTTKEPELNCLTPNEINKANLCRPQLGTISQILPDKTKPLGTTNLAQSSTANLKGTTLLEQSSTIKPPGPTYKGQSSTINPSFHSPEIAPQKNNTSNKTNVKTIFGSPDSLASSYHDTAQGTQGTVTGVFKAAKKQCAMSRNAQVNERAQVHTITSKTTAASTSNQPVAPFIQSTRRVIETGAHVPTTTTFVPNQFKIPDISKLNLPPKIPVTKVTESVTIPTNAVTMTTFPDKSQLATPNDIILDEPGIQPQNKAEQKIDGSRRSNLNSKLYPDLQELLKYGVISKGENVLSLEVKGKTFFASLEASGLIRGTGGEMFKTPMQWCTALLSTSLGVGCIKRQQAYQRIYFKGRPLSSFKIPDIDISKPGQSTPVNEQSNLRYEQSNTGLDNNQPDPIVTHSTFDADDAAICTHRAEQLQSDLPASVVDEAKCLTWHKVRLINNVELNPSHQWLPKNFWSSEGFEDVEFSGDFLSKCIETIDVW